MTSAQVPVQCPHTSLLILSAVSSLTGYKLLRVGKKKLKGEEIMIPGFFMWLLGVPLGIVVLLWLFGVFS